MRRQRMVGDGVPQQRGEIARREGCRERRQAQDQEKPGRDLIEHGLRHRTNAARGENDESDSKMSARNRWARAADLVDRFAQKILIGAKVERAAKRDRSDTNVLFTV